MIRSADYVLQNVLVADEVNTTLKYCKKAQVGVDVSVKNIFQITTPGFVSTGKSYIGKYEKVPVKECTYKDNEGKEIKFNGWVLYPDIPYIVEINEGVKFGAHDTGKFIMRSSLNRNGVSIHSAVWDPKFDSIDGDKVLPVTLRLTVDSHQHFYLEQNARIAQLVVWENEDTVGYGELGESQFQHGKRQSQL